MKNNLKWLFIDHENIGNLDHLDTSVFQKIYVFVGATHKALKINFIQLHQNVTLEVIKIKNIGQNNLDFHLSFFLGKLDVLAESDIEFVILSKDKGFDHLIRYINDTGRKCRRELIPVVKNENQLETIVVESQDGFINPILPNDIQKEVSDIMGRLKKIAGKKRPRKKQTLQNYIKTVYNKHENDIFNHLLKLGCIQDNGSSITYSIDSGAAPLPNSINSIESIKEIVEKLANLSGQQRPRKKKTLLNYIKSLKKGKAGDILNLLIDQRFVNVSSDGKAQYNL